MGSIPDWTIDGLDEAMQHMTPCAATLLWSYLLPLADFQLLHGTVESSSEQFYKRPARRQLRRDPVD